MSQSGHYRVVCPKLYAINFCMGRQCVVVLIFKVPFLNKKVYYNISCEEVVITILKVDFISHLTTEDIFFGKLHRLIPIRLSSNIPIKALPASLDLAYVAVLQ